MVIEIRELQPRNVSLLIVSMESGMEIEVRELQLRNVDSPRVVTLFGM